MLQNGANQAFSCLIRANHQHRSRFFYAESSIEPSFNLFKNDIYHQLPQSLQTHSLNSSDSLQLTPAAHRKAECFSILINEQPGREVADPRPAEAEQLEKLEHQRVPRGRQPLPLDGLHRRSEGTARDGDSSNSSSSSLRSRFITKMFHLNIYNGRICLGINSQPRFKTLIRFSMSAGLRKLLINRQSLDQYQLYTYIFCLYQLITLGLHRNFIGRIDAEMDRRQGLEVRFYREVCSKKN